MSTISYDETETYLDHKNANLHTKILVHNGVIACNKLKLWDWFFDYEPPAERVFMWDKNVNVNAMALETVLIGHSGSTFGYTMRYLQSMAHDYRENPEKFSETCKRLRLN